MPAGLCSICGRGSTAHKFDCPRWRAYTPRKWLRTHKPGVGLIVHHAQKPERAPRGSHYLVRLVASMAPAVLAVADRGTPHQIADLHRRCATSIASRPDRSWRYEVIAHEEAVSRGLLRDASKRVIVKRHAGPK